MSSSSSPPPAPHTPSDAPPPRSSSPAHASSATTPASPTAGPPHASDDASTAAPTLATRTSTRIATKRRPHADVLADIRRQKKRLVLRQDGNPPPAATTAPTPATAATTTTASSTDPTAATAPGPAAASAAPSFTAVAPSAGQAAADPATASTLQPAAPPVPPTPASPGRPAGTATAPPAAAPATPSSTRSPPGACAMSDGPSSAASSATASHAPAAPKKPTRKAKAKTALTPKRPTKKKASATAAVCELAPPVATAHAAPASAAPVPLPPTAQPTTEHPAAAAPVILSVDSDSESDADPGHQMMPRSTSALLPPASSPSAAAPAAPPLTDVTRAPVLLPPAAAPAASGRSRPVRDPALTREPFDLTTFLSRFHTGPQAAPAAAPPASPPPVGTAHQADFEHQTAQSMHESPPSNPALADVLSELLVFLRGQHRHATGVHAATPARAAPTMAPPEYAADPMSWTLPNARGALPPPATCNLRAAHFQPPPQRVRGDFIPTGTHDLAAHRLIPYLTSPEGAHEPPMSYVLRVRQEFTFNSAPAIAIAAYSARFGRHGLTIMHCKRVDRATRLRAGSTDANFNMDFGSNISPPPAPSCTSYFDLLSAVQGLTSFANAHWHEPMARVMYRVREFVTANMDANPAHSADRVERTLDEVNRFLGDAFAPLASGSPYWWREFSAAAAQIEFSSVAWSLALAELAQAPARLAAPVHGRNARPPSASAPGRPAHARAVSERPAGIPEHIRRLIPRDADGTEPCLKFFGGGMCTGGSRSTCTAPGRTHVWPSALPDALTAFIAQRFGGRRASRPRRS